MFDKRYTSTFDDRELFQSVTLEALKLSVNRRISSHELSIANVHLESCLDHLSQDMVYRMTALIASEELSVVRYPADWKQAFKERWFPKWVLDRYPVKYAEYSAKVLYPSISIPEERHYVHFTKMKDMQSQD